MLREKSPPSILYSHSPTFWTHLLFGQLGAWRQEEPALSLAESSAYLLRPSVYYPWCRKTDIYIRYTGPRKDSSGSKADRR